MSDNKELTDYRLDKLEKAHDKQSEIVQDLVKKMVEIQTKLIVGVAILGTILPIIVTFVKDYIKG